MEHKNLAIELADTAALDTGVIKAFAAITGNEDDGADRIVAGAFKKTILERGTRIKSGWQHDLNHPFARTTHIEEVGRDQLPQKILDRAPNATGGLYIEGKVSMTPTNVERLQLMKDGLVDEVSIGYVPVQERFVKAAGKTGGKAIRELVEIKLFEWSPVTLAMNPAAMVTDVKRLDEAAVLSIVNQAMTADSEAKAAVSDAPWDGPAQVADADVSDLRAMCAVVDGDGSAKSDYHLPHHMASAGHPVNENGVKAAAAALSGARGGYQGANAGKAKAHIAAHYHTLGLGKAPWESDGDKGALDFAELLAEVELETKAGRMISARNADRLKAAHDHIHDVLGMASHGMTLDTDDAVAPADIEPDADDGKKALELRGRFAIHEAEALLLKAALA